MVRQCLDVEQTVLNQVLYVGNRREDSAGDVFLFFKEHIGEEEYLVNHAIINPNCAESNSRLIAENCQITSIR